MNLLVYLIYPVMALLLFWGAKPYGKGRWNEEAFSLRQTKALQGFFAICIMLHHIGQKTCASWIESDTVALIPGLEIFVPFGYYFVGVFLFCSGYGLYKSVHEKPNYLNGFGRHRILPLVLAFYSTGLLFLLARFLMKEPLNGWKVFFYASGMKLSNPNSWYVIVLPFFYLVFYLTFRFCKRESLAIKLIVLFTFAYQMLGVSINHNDWWMRGEWWYNSIHFFVIGLLFARREAKITAHLKKWYVLYFILFFLSMFFFYGISEYAQIRFSYYCDWAPLPARIVRRWVCLISQMLASCSFVFFTFLLCMKIRLGNRFLALMGSITLEFYLIHGLFLELFSYDFAGVAPSIIRITNVALLILVVFVPSVPAALAIQKFDRLILSPLSHSRKKDASVIDNDQRIRENNSGITNKKRDENAESNLQI